MAFKTFLKQTIFAVSAPLFLTAEAMAAENEVCNFTDVKRKLEQAKATGRGAELTECEVDSLMKGVMKEAFEEAFSLTKANNASPPAGPPLSTSEIINLRQRIFQCLPLPPEQPELFDVVVTVKVEFTREGKPIAETVELLNYEGGNQALADQMFRRVKRAILFCGRKGFDLPVQKYAHWKVMNIRFDIRRFKQK